MHYRVDPADLDEIASCCNEAFKIATSSAAYLNNYFMLIGTDGVYSYTFEHERREDCPVCGGEALEISISREWTVDRLIEMLVEKQDMYVLLSSILRGLCLQNNPHQSNKKAVVVVRSKTYILSGPPTARAGNAAKFREESIRFGRRRWGNYCDCNHPSV